MEQVDKEHQARRKHLYTWIGSEGFQKLYNPDEINKQLKEALNLQDLCPYKHTGHGDSYFVSPQMYEELFTKCRCGRTRSEAHLLRCVQKHQPPPYETSTEQETLKTQGKVPTSSNAVIGFYQARKPVYQRWEQSMRYQSPLSTIPGEQRITEMSYDLLFIG